MHEKIFALEERRDKLRSISFSGAVKSISDDDLCATCRSCEYMPGEHSGCAANWPGLEDADGYVQICANFVAVS